MNTKIPLERCHNFIHCQLQAPQAVSHYPPEDPACRVVTISRQTGSGGHAVAERLADILQARSPEHSCHWTVFDRNLVETVLSDHHLPSRLAQFMPEDRISEVSDTMDELFGLHPPSWELVRKTAETILHLADMGRVILLGRAANLITARLPHVFNVRLVGSLEKRVEYVVKTANLAPAEARHRVQEEDAGRKRYLKKYFGKDIDDPLLYHMVLNTDVLSHADAARIIADAAMPVSEAVPFGVAG